LGLRDFLRLWDFFEISFKIFLSFAVAMLANLHRTTNVQLLINSLELIDLTDDIDLSYVHYIYISLVLAFMIKSPVVPFHM